MAASKLTSREQGRMNRARLSVGTAGSDPLRQAVRRERRALMRADAVLRCVAVALEYDDWTSEEPDYAEAIGAARFLISQSIDRLEPHADSSPVGSPDSEQQTAMPERVVTLATNDS